MNRIIAVMLMLFAASAVAQVAPAPSSAPVPAPAAVAAPAPVPAVAPTPTSSPAATAPAKASEEKPFVYTPEPYDIVIGKANAPVTIVEYASLSCPHCSHFFNNTFPAIKEKYIDTGHVRFIYRHYPLNDSALKGALLVNCVEKDRRHEFLTVLFKLQQQWAYGATYMDALSNIAMLGGVDHTKFDACMNDTAMQKTIAGVEKEATDVYKVDSTPTFFFNGLKQAGVSDALVMGKTIEQAEADSKKK